MHSKHSMELSGTNIMGSCTLRSSGRPQTRPNIIIAKARKNSIDTANEWYTFMATKNARIHIFQTFVYPHEKCKVQVANPFISRARIHQSDVNTELVCFQWVSIFNFHIFALRMQYCNSLERPKMQFSRVGNSTISS